ncbi:hypothetical protein OA667_02585 [Prochlorococcus sp. AH-716-G10]|nr:hypothetical protein [Prochlorococcus sp. AH-716-G10]
MPRISARFDFFLNLESNYNTEIQSYCNYSLKAYLRQGDESLLWFPLERKIFKNENNEGSQGSVNEDYKFKVGGIFSCKLRQGVAPMIQSKKKEFSLNILASHVLFKGASSGLIEIDLKELYSENRLATAWRLH